LPERKFETLKNAIVVNKDQLVAVYMRDVIDSIEIHNLYDGKFIKSLDIPVSTVSDISGDREAVDFFYMIKTFFIPQIIYRFIFNGELNNTQVFSLKNLRVYQSF
jgi:prolyl oligopeptidase PreP (S9A serine peptidase family)